MCLLFIQMRATLDMLQGELRSERTLRQVAEAKTSKLELEVKKLKADLQVWKDDVTLSPFNG